MQANKLAAFRKAEAIKEMQQLPIRKQFYQQFIQPKDLVFDVGANVGNRVQVFLAISAKVIAVEPQPACINTLEEKFGNDIVIEKVGLGKESGVLEMFIANDSTISTFSKEFIENTSTHRFSNYAWNQTLEVPIVTLDSLIEKHGVPQFCKIDVEGFELNVLAGLTHKIPYLSFEYCVPEMMQNMLDCLRRLNEINPAGLFNYSIAEKMELALPKWISFEEMYELVQQDNFTNTLFGDIYFKS
jgi:FkbM family methyltransferase